MITWESCVRLEQRGERSFAVHGTPADCARLGLLASRSRRRSGCSAGSTTAAISAAMFTTPAPSRSCAKRPSRLARHRLHPIPSPGRGAGLAPAPPAGSSASPGPARAPARSRRLLQRQPPAPRPRTLEPESSFALSIHIRSRSATGQKKTVAISTTGNYHSRERTPAPTWTRASMVTSP
jgi:hypothetical protein